MTQKNIYCTVHLNEAKSKQNYNQRTNYLFKGTIDWEEVQGILLGCLHYSVSWCSVVIIPGKKATSLPRPSLIDHAPSQVYVITVDTDGAPPTSPWVFLWSPLNLSLLYFSQLTAAIFRRLSFGYWSPFGWTCMELEELISPTGQPVANGWLVWESESPSSFPQDKTNSLHNYLEIRLELWLELKLLRCLASSPCLSGFSYSSTSFFCEFSLNKSLAHGFSRQGHPVRTGSQTTILGNQYHMDVAFSPLCHFKILNTAFLIA